LLRCGRCFFTASAKASGFLKVQRPVPHTSALSRTREKLLCVCVERVSTWKALAALQESFAKLILCEWNYALCGPDGMAPHPPGVCFPKFPGKRKLANEETGERNPRLLESAIFSAYCPSAGKRFEKYVITIGRGLLKYAHDVMANKKLYNAPLCAHININGPLSPELRRKKQCVHQNACKLVSFAVGSWEKSRANKPFALIDER
jgi:hypothetical protein